jgi:glycosyltransferase involved in cell wall biosynthesis
MRIVIDLQGAQSTGSRNRGIGRYSTSLALAMCRNRGSHEIILALNSAFGQSVEEIRDEFAELLPPEAIRVFTPLPEVNSLDDRRRVQREASAMAWEAFLASLEPDVVHVSSLFEGLGDDVVTSVARYGFGCYPTAVTLYDLIPLINQDHYLSNPVVDRWYRSKIDHLSRADLLLSISESSRQEGLEYLDRSEGEIVNISTAADAQFKPVSLSTADAAALRQRYGLRRPFIMYTGGIDHRKNIEGLIEGYALLPETLRQNYVLAVVCSCQEADRHRLVELGAQAGLKAGDLVMTGFVPENDLIALYSSCSLFVFPSWHEGFGLPALEAMWCGAPVIASNRSSLPEVIGWEDALFDPLDHQAMSDKMKQALTNATFRDALIDHGAKQCSRFSWDHSAKTALTALEQLVARFDRTLKSSDPTPKKPRLAYVSPIPPARSGIADYSAELIPELSRHYELDLVVPDSFDMSSVEPDLRRKVKRITSAGKFVQDHRRYDRVLYHFGNSDHHTHMFGLLEAVPGVVVLHDYYLSGALSYLEHRLNVTHVWSQALYHSHGYKALDKLAQPGAFEQTQWTYPSNLAVLDNATGVIVHSDYSRRLARQWVGRGGDEKFRLIPLLRVAEQNLDRRGARARLGFDDDDIIICSFGFMAPTKHVQAILNGWLAASASQDKRVHLVFVGENSGTDYGKKVTETIAASGKAERIHITGWLDMDAFRDYLRAADLAIQLRTLSRGETSAAVLDCMNYGLPIIINANGSMADIPADCAVRLDDEFSHSDLIAAIDRLVFQPEARKALGQRGRSLIETDHDPAQCAALYHQAIEHFADQFQTSPLAVAGKVRDSFGSALGEEDCQRLAECLDWNAPKYSVDGRVLINVSSHFESGRSDLCAQNPLGKVLVECVRGHSDPRIEPVYWSARTERFHYARGMMLQLLGLSPHILTDDVVDFRIHDVMINLHADQINDQVAVTALRDVGRRVAMTHVDLTKVKGGTHDRKLVVHDRIQVLLNRFEESGWFPADSKDEL